MIVLLITASCFTVTYLMYSYNADLIYTADFSCVYNCVSASGSHLYSCSNFSLYVCLVVDDIWGGEEGNQSKWKIELLCNSGLQTLFPHCRVTFYCFNAC